MLHVHSFCYFFQVVFVASWNDEPAEVRIAHFATPRLTLEWLFPRLAVRRNSALCQQGSLLLQPVSMHFACCNLMQTLSSILNVDLVVATAAAFSRPVMGGGHVERAAERPGRASGREAGLPPVI